MRKLQGDAVDSNHLVEGEAEHLEADEDDMDSVELDEENMDMGCASCTTCDGSYEYSRKTVRKLHNGDVLWSGNIFKDYVFYVANRHEFIGVFASHPDHPYSKAERILTLTVCSLLTLFGCHFWQSVFQRHNDFAVLSSGFIFFCVSLPVLLISVLIPLLGGCQNRFHLNEITSRGTASRYCWKRCKQCVCLLKVCFYLAVGMVVVHSAVRSFTYERIHGTSVSKVQLWAEFWTARVQTWGSWIVFGLLLPYFGFPCAWYREKTASEDTDAEDGDSQEDNDEPGACCTFRGMRNTCVACFVVLTSVTLVSLYVACLLPNTFCAFYQALERSALGNLTQADVRFYNFVNSTHEEMLERFISHSECVGTVTEMNFVKDAILQDRGVRFMLGH